MQQAMAVFEVDEPPLRFGQCNIERGQGRSNIAPGATANPEIGAEQDAIRPQGLGRLPHPWTIAREYGPGSFEAREAAWSVMALCKVVSVRKKPFATLPRGFRRRMSC
jgi:hypothetical protein